MSITPSSISGAGPIQLGLIGDNIARSQSPRLHRLAGTMRGLDVRYDPLIPSVMGLDVAGVFDHCKTEGFRGTNVTYPYKEWVIDQIQVDEPLVKALGACNTVIFETDVPRGYNTDCSGFAAAFANRFGDANPGRVAMAGAGGVGKAIAFALGQLGATELSVFDRDQAKADALVTAVNQHFRGYTARSTNTLAEAVEGADGVINSTPVGMIGYPGSAFADISIKHCRWAFDAVYTPVETEFLSTALKAGVEVLSGYELFFYQGVHAFRLFTGQSVDEQALRAALLKPVDAD